MPVLFILPRQGSRTSCNRREIHHSADRVRDDNFLFGAQSAAALGSANEFFQALSYVGVFEEITFFGCGHTFRDLAQKPCVVIHETLDGFLDEGLHVAALLSGKSL